MADRPTTHVAADGLAEPVLDPGGHIVWPDEAAAAIGPEPLVGAGEALARCATGGHLGTAAKIRCGDFGVWGEGPSNAEEDRNATILEPQARTAIRAHS